MKGGRLCLHKIVLNTKELMESLPTDDIAKDLRGLDLTESNTPSQMSLGVTWDVKTNMFAFRVSREEKPDTRRGVLSTSTVYMTQQDSWPQ